MEIKIISISGDLVLLYKMLNTSRKKGTEMIRVSAVSYSGAESENFEGEFSNLEDARAIAKILVMQGGFFSSWVQGEGVNEQYPLPAGTPRFGWFAQTRPDLRLRWVPWETIKELFAVPYDEQDREKIDHLALDSFNSENVKRPPREISGIEWSPVGMWIRVPTKDLSPVLIAEFAFWVQGLPNNGWSADEEIVEEGGFLYIAISPD